MKNVIRDRNLARARDQRRCRPSKLSAGYAIALACIAAAAPLTAEPQLAPSLSLEPMEAYIKPGALCTLHVMVDDAVDSLSCMEVTISYDTAIVTCTAFCEGELYSAAPFPTFPYLNFDSPDTATSGNCGLGYRSYILPPGELVGFVFRGRSIGDSPVTIVRARLWDIERTEIAPEIGANSTVKVKVRTEADIPPLSSIGMRCYPNPFNAMAMLIVSIPVDRGIRGALPVQVSVYSAQGRLVRRLYDGSMQPGENTLFWDGKTDSGIPAASGVYCITARTSLGGLSRKIVVLR